MKFRTAAALVAFAFTSPLTAQPTRVDLGSSTPLPGAWSYAATPDGSEATYRDAVARPQLIFHCARASRQVRIAKPASGAAPSMVVWTSDLTRSVPASFDPATGLISVTLTASDPLLDAVALSRARIAVTISGGAQLVVPNWQEVERVIEDCRA
jgi:hypothetical protein